MSNKLLCPTCNTNIPINTNYIKIILRYPPTDTKNDDNFITLNCYHCDQLSIWDCREAPNIFHVVYPATFTAEPAHPDMPEEIKVDFEEARKIAKDSPRGAAALLRLAIQKLMVKLGESGKNINNDIRLLVSKGLPIQIQQALDYCRVTGNEAVHPGSLNLNDTPEMVTMMFKMINMIVERHISFPKQLSEAYSQLPADKLDAIINRDK